MYLLSYSTLCIRLEQIPFIASNLSIQKTSTPPGIPMPGCAAVDFMNETLFDCGWLLRFSFFLSSFLLRLLRFAQPVILLFVSLFIACFLPSHHSLTVFGFLKGKREEDVILHYISGRQC